MDLLTDSCASTGIKQLHHKKGKNMQYIYMREDNGDEVTKEFETQQEAISYGDLDWNKHLTDREREKAEFAYVIESKNPDEDADDHEDGDFVKVWKIN